MNVVTVKTLYELIVIMIASPSFSVNPEKSQFVYEISCFYYLYFLFYFKVNIGLYFVHQLHAYFPHVMNK